VGLGTWWDLIHVDGACRRQSPFINRTFSLALSMFITIGYYAPSPSPLPNKRELIVIIIKAISFI